MTQKGNKGLIKSAREWRIARPLRALISDFRHSLLRSPAQVSVEPLSATCLWKLASFQNEHLLCTSPRPRGTSQKGCLTQHEPNPNEREMYSKVRFYWIDSRGKKSNRIREEVRKNKPYRASLEADLYFRMVLMKWHVLSQLFGNEGKEPRVLFGGFI